MKELTDVTHVELRGTNLTDAGLAHLKDLANLERLNLYNTAIGDAGEHFNGLTKFEFLMLKQTNVTDAPIKNCKRACRTA